MTRRAVALVLVLAASVTSACGSDAPPPSVPDGGAPIDAGPGPTPPAPPAPPAPREYLPCPTGWRDTGDHCDPWGEGGPAECPEDEAQFPGEPACAPIGTICPAGDFPDGLPTDRNIVFVLAGAPAGGTGARDAPYAGIGEALAAAPPGSIVAIGKGTYDEEIALQSDIVLWGACVAQTRIAGSSAAGAATIFISGMRTEIKNLQIGGATRAVWVPDRFRDTRLESVLVRDASRSGLGVVGTLTGRRVVVRDMHPDPAGNFGRGIDASGGAQVDIEQLVIERAREIGVFAEGEGTHLHLADAAVLHTLEGSAGDGRGMEAHGGATVDLERTVFERGIGVGIVLSRAPSALTMIDGIVADSSAPPFDDGAGIVVQLGATADLTRVAILRDPFAGIAVIDRGSATIRDSLVRGTRPGSMGFAMGALANAGGTLELVRTRIDRIGGVGILVHDDGSVALRDSEVCEIDIAPKSTMGVGAVGVMAHSGARLEVERVVVAYATQMGLSVNGVAVTVHDLAVRDTGGYGVQVAYGGMLNGARLLVERSGELGLAVGTDAAAVHVEDLFIRGSEGASGRGVLVTSGGLAEIARASIEGARVMGIMAAGSGRVAATDVSVRDITAGPCGGSSCAAAVVALDGAMIDLRGFAITGSDRAGIQIARAGAVDLHAGSVSACAVGANVQVDGYEVARLMDQVVYFENATELDASPLPVPDIPPLRQ